MAWIGRQIGRKDSHSLDQPSDVEGGTSLLDLSVNSNGDNDGDNDDGNCHDGNENSEHALEDTPVVQDGISS